MVIPKKYLEVFGLVLRGTEGLLSLPESRVRDKFLKQLSEIVQEFYDERTKIYTQFCNKNEDGTPAIIDNKFSFKNEVVEELNKELDTLVNEDVEIETPEGLKEIMEKTTYKPKVGEVEIIDAILAKF